MDSRSTIDYAIGILLANGATTPDDAFQILVRASQRENRTLRDIAREMVEHAAERQPSGDEVPSD
jgi:AmiR/NasT family two-component response regulator